MPKKTLTTETATPKTTRVAKSTTTRTSPVVEVASKPRVKSVKHSKASAPVAAEMAPSVTDASAVETAPVNAHEAIAKIAYGYWVARGFQPGSPEQDWLRAEREYLRA